MCHFITATLPKDAPHEALDAIARLFGRKFQPLASAAITSQLPQGQGYFLTTLGHCDCGTGMGSVHQAAARAPDWAAEEAKLLKKGWSRTKVEQALEQRKEKAALTQERAEGAERTAVESLEGFVAGVLQSGLTSELGLLLHSYRGSLDEQFTIRRQEQIPARASLAEVLPNAEEDVLYVFRAKA